MQEPPSSPTAAPGRRGAEGPSGGLWQGQAQHEQEPSQPPSLPHLPLPPWAGLCRTIAPQNTNTSVRSLVPHPAAAGHIHDPLMGTLLRSH